MGVAMTRAYLVALSMMILLVTSNSASAQTPSRGFDWSGFHWGIFSGYAVGGHWKGDAADYPHLPVNGWFGGAAIGYDYQSASGWVVGIETDRGLWVAALVAALPASLRDASASLRALRHHFRPSFRTLTC